MLQCLKNYSGLGTYICIPLEFRLISNLMPIYIYPGNQGPFAAFLLVVIVFTPIITDSLAPQFDVPLTLGIYFVILCSTYASEEGLNSTFAEEV